MDVIIQWFRRTFADPQVVLLVLLVLAIISGIGNIVKYYTRATFWGFCITQLVFGFFLGMVIHVVLFLHVGSEVF